MKKCIIIVLIIALNINVLQCLAIGDESIFNDLSSASGDYRAAVSLKNLGVIDGKADRIFAPEDMLTREEFAKIISLAAKIEDITVEVQLEDIDASAYKNNFFDVSPNSWYGKYVETAFESGLLLGISDVEFGVGSNITNQDAMTVLYRLLRNKMELPSDLELKLPADADLSDYAKEAIGSLAAVGVIAYDEQNLFHPLKYITRARLCKNIYDTLTYIYSMKNFGVSGRNIWSKYPDSEPQDDKLTKYMPEVFDVEKMEKTTVVFDGFEDTGYAMKSEMVTWSATEEEVYEGKRSYKFTAPASGEKTIFARFRYNLSPSDIGASFTASCMVKCKDMAKATGFCVDVYNKSGGYLQGFYQKNQAKGTTDWISVQQLFAVPENAAYFYIQIYFDASTGGEAYYDNLAIQKVAMKPLSSTVLSPAYKGFIYGDGDINYDIMIDEQAGLYDCSKLKLNIKLADEKDKVYVEKNIDYCTLKQNVTLLTNGLPEGDYYLETRLLDKESGEEIQLDYNVIRKRAENYRPLFYVDEFGRCIKDGKPYFMRGIYDLCGDEWKESHWELAFDYLNGSDINFNAYNLYDNFWRYNEPLYFTKPFSDLQKSGVSVSAGFHNFGESYQKEQGKNARYLYSNIVKQIKHYPNNLGYYLYDEADFDKYTDSYKWKYDVISDADPDKPIFGAHYKTTFPYGTFTKATDVLFEDIYPVYGLETDDIAAKGRAVRTLRDQFPNRPIYSVIQAFKGGMIVSQGQREPNEEELRNMVWQSICEGTQGITFWASLYVYTLPNLKPSLSWQEYMGIQNELMGEVKQLEDVLTSVDPKPYYDLKGSQDCFNVTSKHYNGKSYVFMVNNTHDAQSGVLKLDDNVKSITSLYTGETYNVNRKGLFEIDFDPLFVDVFEYEQGSYQSSESELKSLTFYLPDNEAAVISYINEEEVIRLPKSVETLKYSATVGRKANIYLNGILSETSGSMAVNGKGSINVKVVSENGKYTTEKEYKLLFEEEAE